VLLALIAASALVGDGMPPEEYYKKLAEDCRKRESVSCCMAAVRVMKANGWRLAPDKGCPKGAAQDMLKCEDTYRWCVPYAAKTEPRISRKKAIALAKKAIKGKVSYPPGTPILVEERGVLTLVTFKTVLKPNTLGADYHAEVTLDAKTGEVLKVLGSQD
jgi:hypothetical protein